ncbi:hypothetical protein GQ457_12G016600 [Hibiscus cannabinus]
MLDIYSWKERKLLLNRFYKLGQFMQCMFSCSINHCVMHELESIMCKFWWLKNYSKHRIHWTIWSSLCLPKKSGARVALNFQPSCLLASVLKAKYYPSRDFLNARLGSYPSYTWKSIWYARGLLEQGLGWRVGNGLSISNWNDAWIFGPGNGRVIVDYINSNYSLIADLINSDHCWKRNLILSLFSTNQANQILCMHLPTIPLADLRIWRGDSIGIYSVCSGYIWLIHSCHGLTGDPNLIEENWFNIFLGSLWSLSPSS